MIHRMKLSNEAFEKIVSGKKTYELRLFDGKRKKLKLNDEIIFINTKTKKRIITKVLALHITDSFKSLFELIDITEAGFENCDEETAALIMRKYYTEREEKESGVVAIKISTPEEMIEYPVKISDREAENVIVLPIFNDKLYGFTEGNADKISIPFGCVRSGEDTSAGAERVFYEKMINCEIASFYPLFFYLEGEKKGRVFVAVLKDKPSEKDCKVKELNITPERRWDADFPELPEFDKHRELLNMILYTLQRMFYNSDICVFDEGEDEYYDYEKRIMYYDEDVYFDYENFDADEFAFYIMMRSDSDDIYDQLEKVPATEENLKSIREELFVVNSLEYLDWIVENFGTEVITNDEKLMQNLFENYNFDYVTDLLGIELEEEE